MKIIQDEVFTTNLRQILKFISNDSKQRAKNFSKQLLRKIEQLKNMPYKYRKSYYYNLENTRDLICKGYTIPYFIDEESEIIVILDIFKWSQR